MDCQVMVGCLLLRRFYSVEKLLLRNFEGGFDGAEGELLLVELAAAFDGEAEEHDEDAEHEPSGHVPEHGRVHAGIEAGVFSATKDGGGVLGAPPADGHEDDRDIDAGEDSEDGGERGYLLGGG